ncbi:hypothetical protein [Brachybacterium tyrofermentans]|uniref:hypothetical protein n=1 Tax=Brachybacterium tyrofermentans TaxID=47848 RepID=UPI003FCF836D
MIRTKTRIFTVLTVGVLALAGCTGGDENPAPTPSAQESAPSDGGGGTSYATEGPGEKDSEGTTECKADDSDQEVPTEAPKADAWPEVNGVGVPVSDSYGPTNREGEVWTCFSHSPTGALFAAAYLQAGISSADVREEYITDDPAVEDGDGEPSTGTSLRGYKITAYDESSVSVELVFETASSGESALVATPTTLYWDEGWTSTQESFTSSQPRQVTGLAGYTQWSVGS